MSFVTISVFALISLPSLIHGLRFDSAYEAHNLNQNRTAENPLDYWGEWTDHSYNPSPSNWRFPFYTLFLDRFVNGDPTNDNSNGTLFEQDITSTQFRHGGDLQGLVDSLDYIQGMGVEGIYIAGSPFINKPWQSDSYSPLDHTLLDEHFGNISEWREAITEIHSRGMYVLMDNTVATMGDLVGFDGYLNESTPFVTGEHPVLWKSDRRYLDFDIGFDYNETCEFPRLWAEDGYLISDDVMNEFKGCYDGDFDQFGDTEAFGVYPDYRRQLTKFASVQDRLREWVPSVREKIEHFSCITIAMLDIDGFRYDKATQVTVDATGQFSTHLRECARRLGKDNFFLPGEITGGNTFGSLYIGRGRQPDQYFTNLTTAVSVTNGTAQEDAKFLHDEGQNGLDSAAFHYSIYRHLTRFLGMDGNLEAGFDLPRNWVDSWNEMLLTNDFLNPNTGVVDPRHMYGVTNQDVFRWPAIHQGIERMLLGQFITSLHMPGVPLMLWGEEQAFYVLDSTADNYIYGRQAMSPSPAWQTHGCYSGGSDQYFKMPLVAARTGCLDETVSWDHRDPSHPIRNVIKAMYKLRNEYPVLHDGLFLQQLSNQTEMITYPGSNETSTETGLWSVMRSAFEGVQDFGNSTAVWLVYHNRNETTEYSFDCTLNTSALIAPFDAGTTVKNLFFPHDEITLTESTKKLGIKGSTEYNGCSSKLSMLPYEFRAYVPKSKFVPPPAMITMFSPGHDSRVISAEADKSVKIEFHVSAAMDCDSFTRAIEFASITGNNAVPEIDNSTVICTSGSDVETLPYIGAVASAWKWSASITNVEDGVHQIIVRNATTEDMGSFTNSVDRFLIRLGTAGNPIVFPTTGNYSSSLLTKSAQGDLTLHHEAAGASKWRYSLNWGSTWSDWTDYESDTTSIDQQQWSGTESQAWDGEHVIVQYFSKLLGSSSIVQHGDVDHSVTRRFPHLWANGPFNQFGFDAGIHNQLHQTANSQWEWHFMVEWPSRFQLNVWGMNPDGQPDQSFVYGDNNGDFVIDRLPPSSLVESAVNVTDVPPAPYLAYRLVLDDATLNYDLVPTGDRGVQLALYIILWLAPLISGILCVYVFKASFYKVKYVEMGLKDARSKILPYIQDTAKDIMALMPLSKKAEQEKALVSQGQGRRCVLIATMEYNIDDWNIKIKIGGLGVMAQLMGTSLQHQDLIWVVPCVGGIEYPIDTPAKSMFVTVLGMQYEVEVQYHKLGNITYVLLDAPVFRRQTKAEPYPPRMDDLDSAIYYSAWNQCIAEASKRFPVDLYHINDYHGAAAPLYLLPNTIPAAMSLHNAEFQGMWPMRTPAEAEEVCKVYNLDQSVVSKYVQYGSVFNLLHAGASYLRVHQKGFGAVGVSKKYGDRSFARYPILWGLRDVGQLPNPDPTDTAEWDREAFMKDTEVAVDANFENGRADLKRQAQEWAGLEVNPKAELFVFVGRWSLQKGVDLIADIFPAVLEQHPDTQLVCVGPVIDLYGKFAALKLSKLMEKYPKRVYSKPEFTALPPYLFSGAEFALIPSRDEPCNPESAEQLNYVGLVAVEFGRKGALGVGARVGGLGQMPGWWYTIESTSAAHLLAQFKEAITSALETKQETRAMMRAWSAKQRFPVAQWLEDLETLQSTAIRLHEKPKPRRQRKKLVRNSTLSMGNQPGASGRESPAQTEKQAQAVEVLGELRLPEFPSETVTSTPELSPLSSRRSSITGFQTPPDNVYLTPRDGSPPLSSSSLSVNEVVGGRSDFKLQRVDLFFTDSRGEFYDAFEKKLDDLSASNSTSDLCIQDYLTKSEKQWFSHYRNAKLGRQSVGGSAPNSRPGSSRMSTIAFPFTKSRISSQAQSVVTEAEENNSVWAYNDEEDFGLAKDYKPPGGVQSILQRRIGDWPIYSMLLALSQVIASNSYQITLLTGEVGQSASKLYVVASVYLASTILWYILSRTKPAIYVLSIPFLFYGVAFLILGASPFANTIGGRGWMQNVATGLYAVASSSGALAFAFNFGDEGGSPVTTWIYRATIIQGLQQIYSLGLWAWGSIISTSTAAGQAQSASLAASPYLMAVCAPIAVILWAVGLLLFLGLPDYYRETPGAVPMLWRSLAKRRTIVWFLFAVVLQNYFLSAPYGRNWFFLFGSQHVSTGAVVLLALGFFGLAWTAILFVLSFFSRSHPWLFPLFAVGLGAPRWAQMLWGTSGIGLYLPWAGGHVASALASRSLWLWLGLLDGIQGAGVGMILMLTLTRVHVAAAVVAAQVIGSLATIVGRASAPDKVGPGDVFPDFSQGVGFATSKAWFWVVLVCQLGICAGYFKFFRKEQVSKP
ncbi:Uu.00g046890.m01.CDS01 [Anthostomella pinea]|uniref:alpha-1,3-glucan synthase n=1 Tax=Anthostomella pinea TaxID=933095 RepID=A0AAI8VCF4_9PEZI|nr:Uu.00g046890.m01.CDS01 [Anthostomella pinea]